ncbi:hypothetical protein KAI87_00350 [Myxococcota bacterium]|nr:hypothetical protein [Myxococcota bacterium]
MNTVVNGVKIFPGDADAKTNKVYGDNLLVDDGKARLYGPFKTDIAIKAAVGAATEDKSKDFLILQDKQKGEVYLIEGEVLNVEGKKDLDLSNFYNKTVVVDNLSLEVSKVLDRNNETNRNDLIGSAGFAVGGAVGVVLGAIGGLVGATAGLAVGATTGAIAAIALTDAVDDLFDSPNAKLKTITEGSDAKMVDLSEPRPSGFSMRSDKTK